MHLTGKCLLTRTHSIIYYAELVSQGEFVTANQRIASRKSFFMDDTSVPPALRRESLSTQVARHIRNAILTGDYQLGQRLRELELAERFGVSNSVVREALGLLQGQGLIVNNPYRGRSVFDLTPEQAKELFFMRTSLESLACVLAINRLNEDSRKDIAAAAKSMKTAPAKDFPERVAAENRFHRLIWASTGNEWLQRTLEQLIIPLLCIGTARLSNPNLDIGEILEMSQGWEDNDELQGHQPLAEAYLKGDSAEAREKMIVHLLWREEHIDLRKQAFGC